VTDAGERDAVAPEGAPETLRATVSAEPLVTAVEIVDVPEAPDATVRLLGEALIEKSFWTCALTVSVMSAEWEVVPSNPVTVSVYWPGAAVPVFTVNVAESPAFTDDWSSVTVAPVGTPETLSATVRADPLVTAVEIVEVAARCSAQPGRRRSRSRSPLP